MSSTSRARAHLRALAHHLEPVVTVGAEGLSDSVLEAIRVALNDHELIKVRLGGGFTGPRREAAADLAKATDSDLTQVIGRVVALYRRREDDRPGRPRIALPA